MTPVSAPTVLILAAGQGTRMRSRTPKVLHELCGIPMVLWPVRAALAAGAGRVVVVDSPERPLADVLAEQGMLAKGECLPASVEQGMLAKGECLPASVEQGMLAKGECPPASAGRVELAVQPTANGTGGAVIAGMAKLDSHGDGDDAIGGDAIGVDTAVDDAPVVILSGDVPLVSAEAISALVNAHTASGAQATMASTVLDDPSGYGRVVRDEHGRVARVVETKTAGDATVQEMEIREVNTGIYVFSAGALREALPRLTADNAQGELYLPQALDLIRAGGGAVAAHVVSDERLVLGVNDRAALARVRALAQESIHTVHMAAGVTIVDPRATVIDVDVQIGADTTIEPFTTIRGHTRIGEGCVVRHSYLIDCTLEDGATVGPFAYLRPGTVLRAGAKAGTFVEVKNSNIGAGAKVPHLSYIGDADVGEGTNLGAATITANYDGANKHRTTIGRGVRGGVDTSLVAPVTVGDGAVIAAGSVLTEDVPPGALAVARARQRNIEGYAERGAQVGAGEAQAGAAPADKAEDGRAGKAEGAQVGAGEAQAGAAPADKAEDGRAGRAAGDGKSGAEE